ncbi:MAG: hypothetical protein O3A39_00400 [Proteobacteria bacterium]|nr:hypothetical protein [Pseudomonadota bacterium]MDA1135276.1 hypothetical protein [Pseudomonadota bacterium]
MISKFESLFTTKDLVRSKYPNGWVGWLNDKMSDEDDGCLTRFTTMVGRHMHHLVEKLISYGFKPPILKNNKIHFYDFYLNVYEYRDYSKYVTTGSSWLQANSQPKKSIKDIVDLGLNYYDFNGTYFSLCK